MVTVHIYRTYGGGKMRDARERRMKSFEKSGWENEGMKKEGLRGRKMR
jgi:hypothetical protein